MGSMGTINTVPVDCGSSEAGGARAPSDLKGDMMNGAVYFACPWAEEPFLFGYGFSFGPARSRPRVEKTQAQIRDHRGLNKKDLKEWTSRTMYSERHGANPQKLFEQAMKKDVGEKPAVMKRQQQLLNDRYNLGCRSADGVKMTKGKPQPIGPTVKLPSGITWDQLAQLGPDEIKKKDIFPAGFDRLPHVKHAVGGQVFPQIQIKEFPRLERFDVDFDLPECLLPEFPPPIFLTIHPELGDGSPGEFLHAENFDRLSVSCHAGAARWLRMLVTQFAQEGSMRLTIAKRPSPVSALPARLPL